MTAILSARGLSVRLGRKIIVRDANLTLRGGQFTVMIGPNGAGKTTLIRALAGLLPADGAIDLDGTPLAAIPPRERARRLAYLPQGNLFHWPLPVEQIVALGRYPHGDPFSAPSKADTSAVEAALAATGLQDFAQRPVTQLSGGEKARVALARALATNAALLLADEPTMSLDPRHQLMVMELLRASARRGAAVLAVVHDLALAARYADRIVTMEGGHLWPDADPREALSAEHIAAIFGVEAELIDSGQVRVPLAIRAI